MPWELVCAWYLVSESWQAASSVAAGRLEMSVSCPLQLRCGVISFQVRPLGCADDLSLGSKRSCTVRYAEQPDGRVIGTKPPAGASPSGLLSSGPLVVISGPAACPAALEGPAGAGLGLALALGAGLDAVELSDEPPASQGKRSLLSRLCRPSGPLIQVM